MLEQEPLRQIVLEKDIKAFTHEGFWQCMDHKSDKDLLEKYKREKCTMDKKRLLVVGGTGFLGKHI